MKAVASGAEFLGYLRLPAISFAVRLLKRTALSVSFSATTFRENNHNLSTATPNPDREAGVQESSFAPLRLVSDGRGRYTARALRILLMAEWV